MAFFILGTGNNCTICEEKRHKRGNVINTPGPNGIQGYMIPKKRLYVRTTIFPLFQDKHAHSKG